ncbi:hypothetical protein KIF24_17550 [Micromonospora sp. Llam7]|uniref:hypothetical protein n=1 Tax=Micromonospora tarapacensis TaxID=2835305 RepID=UPI001C829A6C|nr:hypothetical protein [Micromonospora tarapacensis]MBX7267664.1 hypothetical protein [Micromonospora tarapacensis]
MSTSTTSPEPPAGDSIQTGPGGEGRRSPLTAIRRRLRTGELGAWPVIIGLIVIWVVFQSLNDRFLSPQNLSNLTLQIVATGTISVGVVLVLLLGEIDLSVGSVAGVAAAALAVLTVRHGWGTSRRSSRRCCSARRSAPYRAPSSPGSGCPPSW